MKLSISILALALLGVLSGVPALAAEKAPSKKVVKSQPKATAKAKAKPKKPARKQVAKKPVEKNLKSPIQNNALDKGPADSREPEIKARSVPDRAYAVGGASFFFQGRKYRIAGMNADDGSDMAMQRLQKSLESGNLTIEPLDTDDFGVSTAVVRINGQDIVNQLR